MSNEIILYDLPSQEPCHCWSLNPWKTRLALNYKGLPYKTEWTEYPDLKPKFSSLGIEPNDPSVNAMQYTSPAVKLPDGAYVMESMSIAKALEKLQPEPSLHLDSEYISRVPPVGQKILTSLAPIGMPRIPVKILREASQPYFRETREKRFGMPLEELAKSDKAKNAWNEAEAPIKQMVALLKENESGPYFMGKQVSYADFVLAGLCRFVELLDDGGDLFGKAMSVDEVLPKHYEACKEWLKRDDH